MYRDRILQIEYKNIKSYFSDKVTEEIFNKNINLVLDYIYKKHEYFMFV